MSTDRVRQLEQQIEDLRRRWPAHSVPAAMVEQLDELEEELENERRRIARQDDASESGQE